MPMPPVKQMLLTPNQGGRPGLQISPRALVIHWTANLDPGADAVANRNYFENNPQNKVSAHYVVDNRQAVQCLPEEEMAYHVGAYSYKPEALRQLSSYPNDCTISLEICVNSDGNFVMTYQNVVGLTTDILSRWGWGVEKLWRHYDVSGKDCPRFFVVDATARAFSFESAQAGWDKFKLDVSTELAKQEESRLLKDVEGHWAQGSIEKMARMGILKGQPDGLFHPDEQLTRAEAAVMLDRAINYMQSAAATAAKDEGSRLDERKLCAHTVDMMTDTLGEEVTPWGVERIGAPYIWSKAKGEGVVVAILDTGCDFEHPDLLGQVIDGRNFTSDYSGDPSNFRDNHYHGTHVAGTLAAALNSSGIMGVAPAVRLLIGKVLTAVGSGATQWITDAIRWAVTWRGPSNERVRVISMSLGGPQDDARMHEAIKEAVAAGVLVVCAAGNDGPGHAEYPGSYPEVVEVGATDQQDNLAYFSNTNPEIDLVAPGVNILSTYPGGRYASLSGTSMATPHTTAAAALVIQEEEGQYQRTLTEAEVFAQLIKRVKDIGLPKTQQGSGLLHLADAPSPPSQPKPLPHVYNIYLRQEKRPGAGNGYAVQLGFFNQRPKALALAQQLKSDLTRAGAQANIFVG